MYKHKHSFTYFFCLFVGLLFFIQDLGNASGSNSPCPLFFSKNQDNEVAEKCWETTCPNQIDHYLLKYTCIPENVTTFQAPDESELLHEIILPNTQQCFNFETDFLDTSPPLEGIDDCAGAWFQIYVVYGDVFTTNPELVYFAAIKVNFCDDPKSYSEENGGQTGAAILATVEDCNC